MALVTTRIAEAKLLLSISDSQNAQYKNQAQSLIRKMNLYYLSPVFLAMGGIKLKHQLEDKYGIRDDFTFCDFLMNFFTVPFCDESIIFSAYIIAMTLMCVLWLPVWQQSAYNHGFNNNHGWDGDGWPTAFDLAYDGGHNHACYMCNWDIECGPAYISDCSSYDRCYVLNVSNSQVYCELDDTGSPCSNFDTTWKYAIQNATNQDQSLYVDPASCVNDTFTTYFLTGNFNGGDWRMAVCNRTTEAIYQYKQAKTKWIWSYVGILIGSVIFLFIYNYLLDCFHSVSHVVNPSNYRLVRRDIESVEPSKPITHASEIIG